MKRSPMPPRQTPLRRVEMPRGRRLKPVSAKRARVNRQRRELAEPLRGAPCRLQTRICTRWAQHWHELVGAGRGGSKLDARNLVPACDACNGYVEDFPAEARREGWKVPAWEAIEGVGGLVPKVPNRLAVAWDDDGDDAA